MHPLSLNIQSLSYEDLEKRSIEINKRLQMIRRTNQSNPLVLYQLQLYLDEINQEKQERAIKLNANFKDTQSGVVISTDPLEDDQIISDVASTPVKGFNPIS